MARIARALAAFIIRFRWPVIVGTLVLAVGFSVLIGFLKFENDLTFWVDKDSPIGKMPHHINETFGNTTPLLISIKTDGFFTRENLEKLTALSNELSGMESVQEVIALSTVDEITPIPYGIRVDKLIPDPLPQDPADPEALAALGERVLAGKKYAGRLVSADGTVALVVVKPAPGRPADKIARLVRAAAEQVFPPGSADLYFSGNTFLLNAISGIVINDFIFLVPLVSVLVVGVLFLSFRSLRGVALPLLTVLFSTALTMGIMSLLRIPLNVMSSAVPVILIAVGSAYGIHVVNNYYEQAARTTDRKEIIEGVIRAVGLPVCMAGLTTMVGFLSNLTADVSIIKTFGLFTALGVALAVIIALLFIPAVLSVLKVPSPRGKTGRSSGAKRPAERFTVRIAGPLSLFVIRHKLPVILFFAVITVAGGIFAASVGAKVDILGYFSADSEPRIASEFVNENFGGFNPLNIYMKADAADPDVLKLIMLLEEELKAAGDLPAPSGIADVVCELNNAMTGFNTVPETKTEVENLLFFVEGRSTLSGMVTPKRDEALVSVLLPSLENTYVNALFARIDSFLDGFRGGIRMEENHPAHPALLRYERLLLSNLFREYTIDADEEDLDALAGTLSRAAQSFRAAPNLSLIRAYLTGDEAEIIMEDDEADRLMKKLSVISATSRETVGRAIAASLLYPGDVTAEETGAFAISILQRMREAGERGKLAALDHALVSAAPGLARVPPEQRNYVLSPFLWKTIPAAVEGRLVRVTPVERLEITGTARLMEDIRSSIFGNQLSSILFALCAVLILNAATFRSVRQGLVSLSAIGFSIIVNFGVMGIAGIPLDFVTAIIASVAIGTGIDYTIHFITRLSKERAAGRDAASAFKATLASTGRAIVFNAAAVALGFAVLLGSAVIPLRTAGILLASTMATSSLAALTLLPAVLLATRAADKKNQ